MPLILCFLLLLGFQSQAQIHELFWQDGSLLYPQDSEEILAEKTPIDYEELPIAEKAAHFRSIRQKRATNFLNLAQNLSWYQDENCRKKVSKKTWEQYAKNYDLESFTYKLKLNFDEKQGLLQPEILALGLNFTKADGAFAPVLWIKPETAPRTKLVQAQTAKKDFPSYEIFTEVELSIESGGLLKLGSSPNIQNLQQALFTQVWSEKRGFAKMKLQTVSHNWLMNKQTISLDPETNWAKHHQWLKIQDSLFQLDEKTSEPIELIYKAASEPEQALTGFGLGAYLIYDKTLKRFFVCFDYLDLDLTWRAEEKPSEAYLQGLQHLRPRFHTLRFELD